MEKKPQVYIHCSSIKGFLYFHYYSSSLSLHSTVVLLKDAGMHRLVNRESCLHSTVVLLKAAEKWKQKVFLKSLHSTVVLLKEEADEWIEKRKQRLHSTVVLLKVSFCAFSSVLKYVYILL